MLNSVQENPLPYLNSAYQKLNSNNQKLYAILQRKQIFFQEIRNFFTMKKFLEIHTPTLVNSPGVESYIEPYEVIYFDYHDNQKKYYLPTSPEFSLKEALGAGLEKIFEICKSFRNSGENSLLHNPDFFMLEWYRAYEDYDEIMIDCKNLILYLSKKIYKKKYINFQNNKCDLTKIEKITVKQLFQKHKINLDDYHQNEVKFINAIENYLKLKNSQLNKDDLFFKFFLDILEPELGFKHPVIVYEYPFEMANLSKRCKNDALYAERFELYICGIEIANCFGELINTSLQIENFQKTLEFRKKNHAKINLELPQKFIQVLKFGLPPCSGIALGIERLFMLFENVNSIKDISLYNFNSFTQDTIE